MRDDVPLYGGDDSVSSKLAQQLIQLRENNVRILGESFMARLPVVRPLHPKAAITRLGGIRASQGIEKVPRAVITPHPMNKGNRRPNDLNWYPTNLDAPGSLRNPVNFDRDKAPVS